MKKKILLLICLATVATLSFAQEMTQNWNSQLGQPRAIKDAYSKDLVHIDANGNTYVCGGFSQDFNIGNNDLMPIGNSAYLAKIDNTGAVQWAVALQGNVTPAYMTTDSEGNLYLTGGSDGVEVILQSSDGTTKRLEGNDHFLWSEDANTVLAKYNTNGILQEGKIFLHDNSSYSNKVLPMGLIVNNENIYLALNIVGETTIDGQIFSGTTANTGGVEENLISISAAHVLSFNSTTLTLQKQIASIIPENATDDWSISSFTMTSNDDNLYIAFLAPAKQKVTAGTSTYTTDFAYSFNEVDEWYEYHRGIGFFNINKDGNIDLWKTLQSTAVFRSWAFGYETINYSFVNNNSWIIAGAYNGKFIFDENAPETGAYASAPFFALLDKSTANVQKSGYWGAENKLNSAAVGDALLVSLYNSTDKTSTLNVYDFGTQNVTNVETTEAGTSINGIASTDTKVATCKATAGAEAADLAISMNTLSGISAGISESSTKAVEIKAYPNPVNDILNFSETCEVTIVNGQGSEVKTVTAATQISVADLAAGYYVAKIKTADGTTVIPFIKK